MKSRSTLAGIAGIAVGSVALITLIENRTESQINSTSTPTPDRRGTTKFESKKGDRRQTPGDLATEVGKLTIEEKIAGLLSETASHKRQDSLAQLAEQLVKRKGIRNALKILAELSGPGRDREWMIAAAVASAPDSLEEVLNVGRELQLRSDSEAFRNGITARVQKNGFLLAEWNKSGPFSTDEIRAIVSGAGMSSFSGKDQRQLFASRTSDIISFVGSMVSGDEKSDLITNYFMNLSMHNPTLSLETMLEVTSNNKIKLRNGFSFEQIVRLAVRADPEEALKLLMENQKSTAGQVRSDSIEQAVSSWIRNDQRAAEEWLLREALWESIPQSVLPFLRYELHEGNFGDARVWLEKISDPEIRKKAEGEVWNQERETLRKQVQNDPVKTVESIVAGQSDFTDYWLEEALNTWASKDVDAANEWYAENWKSLPEEKAQYIAAAFATQAINAGDVKSAKEWSALIQDAKTKARIEASITKAAGGR